MEKERKKLKEKDTKDFPGYQKIIVDRTINRGKGRIPIIDAERQHLLISVVACR